MDVGLCAQDQKEIKRLKQELRRKEKALADAAELLIASQKIQAFWGRERGQLTSPDARRNALEILDEGMANGVRGRELVLLLGVVLTTLQRWRRRFAVDVVDRRKGSCRHVVHRLSEEER
jgi:hypothetical protein